MPLLFRGPRLKIERAKQHIGDLHARLCALSTTDYHRLSVERDPNTGDHLLAFEITQPLPDDVALIVGDAIHNLKSALDFAINDVVFEKTGKRSRHTKFPVYDSRSDLVVALNGGTIRPASETIANLLLDGIKPYKGGNDAIWAIHDLNIQDKHALLLPVIQIASLLDVCAEDERGNRILNGSLITVTGRVSVSFAATTKIKITNHGKATFAIFFDKGLPVEGHNVIETLRTFTEVVGGVIDAFSIALS